MSDPEILLLGAGHANLLAAPTLRASLPRARITLIDPAPRATYSGMLPGWVVGRYAPEESRVDLARFAARHDLSFLQEPVTGLDPVVREVILPGGRRIRYDFAALDVGSHSAMPEIEGFARYAVPIKPLDGFAARLAETPAETAAAVIGGGVAGVEIALALARRLSGSVTLIEAGSDIAASLAPRTRSRLRAALDRAGIRLRTRARVARIEAGAIILCDGGSVASAMTIGVAGARAHAWLARDLPVDGAGFARVMPTLQVEGYPTLFAAGDCAAMIHAPRPKAGVYAVRQGPVLARNIVAAHQGARLARYDPQRDYLKIVALGDGSALAEWRGLTLHGRWLWRWKDRIDRQFMHDLQE